jgi:hypothetical protein
MKTYFGMSIAAFLVAANASASIAHAATNPCAAVVDTNNDSQAELRVAYVYAQGYLHAEATYLIGQSQPKESTQYVYDRQGRLWGKAVDTNGDGVAERHVYYVYRDGKLSAEGVDDGPDGILDQIIEYSYSGNVRLSAVDLQANGTVDRYDRLTSFYDSDGRLSAESFDQGDDGVAVQKTFYTYDASGNLSDKYVDRDGDGSTDEVTHYKYQC